MYRVKVVGEYIARSGIMEKEKIKKTYEVEGNVPSLVAVLSTVKNKLLGPALAKKYPDYVTFLTHYIVEITPLDQKSKEEFTKSEVEFMGREALLVYIKENGLPVNAGYYPNLFKLREAVQFAKEDPKGYSRHFALREPDLRMDLEIAKANPQLFTESQDFIAGVSLPPASAAKAATTKVHSEQTEKRLNGLKADQIRDGEMGPMDTDVPPDSGDL